MSPREPQWIICQHHATHGGVRWRYRGLALKDYDGGSLEGFPSRAGWGLRPLSDWHDIFRTASPTFQAFLQTWRFFGLIGTVFRLEDGRRPGLAEFTRQLDDPPRTVVDTSTLEQLAETCMNKLCRERDSFTDPDLELARQSISYLQKLESLFYKASKGCDCSHNQSTMISLDAYLSNREIVDPLDPRVIDSIVIMFDLIQHLFTSFLHNMA